MGMIPHKQASSACGFNPTTAFRLILQPRKQVRSEAIPVVTQLVNGQAGICTWFYLAPAPLTLCPGEPLLSMTGRASPRAHAALALLGK